MVQSNDSLRLFTRMKTIRFKNFWKSICIQFHGNSPLVVALNLWLDRGKGSVMKSAESGGTINQRLIVDSLFRISWYHCVIRYNVKHFKGSSKNGSISSPQYGFRYLMKGRKLYLLHSMDTDI